MLSFIIFLVMIFGIICWLFAIVEFFVFQADPLFALFLLVLGGQLAKLAYAFCESEDLDKKYKNVMAALKRAEKRF